MSDSLGASWDPSSPSTMRGMSGDPGRHDEEVIWGPLSRSRVRLPLRLVALAAIKGFVMDLHAEPVPEQVREFCVLGPVERIDAQQELVVVSGEDSPPERDRRRTD